MPKSLHMPSFGCGLLAATILACVIGAAENDRRGGPKYNAAPWMGGLVLQIVDHESDLLYNYRRVKRDGGITYDLIETVDLLLAGNAEIPAKSAGK